MEKISSIELLDVGQARQLKCESDDGTISRTMSPSTRTVLVTGSTGAIGKAIAEGIASLPNYELIAVGRNPTKVEALLRQLRRESGAEKARGEVIDLSSRQSIEAFAARFEGPLDVLINNAAVAPPQRQRTAEGIEAVFATNVLGYVWMTKLLTPLLRKSKEPRVVNVASYWAGDLDLTDLEFRRRPYDNDVAYRQSKQANRMLTVAWAKRLESDGISVNCCHPGDVNSRLSNDLGFGGSESPDTGASTPLWLALASELCGKSGGYFEHERAVPCRFANDLTAVERLAEICDGYG